MTGGRHSFETHRCDGSLLNECSIRRYPKRDVKSWFPYDGEWHLMKVECDLDYDISFLDHVAPILFCPFCGKELP